MTLKKKQTIQMTFGEPEAQDVSKWILDNFSAGNVCDQSERLKIEEKYRKITDISDIFNRQSVSYQLSKKDTLHSWLKYKEGFSADLVNNLLNEMNISEGDTVLDPFLGSGTTSMVCKMNNINSIGFDILPISELSIMAKNSLFSYNLDELEEIRNWITEYELPEGYTKKTPYVKITDGAYPEKTEHDIQFITEWIENSNYSEESKRLLKLCMLNSLEQISYTSKDGQYLAWDYRSKKTIAANEKRRAKNQKESNRLDKGIIPTTKEIVLKELDNIIKDIRLVQSKYKENDAKLQFIGKSVLFGAPELKSECINGVITSPPYCNRYDYTRTYALELAYLGLDTPKITELRQELLSCTVENKSKLERLGEYYTAIGKKQDYDKVCDLIKNNAVLNEIDAALRTRMDLGEINNKGVLRMVHDYFSDLTFVYYELFRLCKSGAKVAFVNDNVRYAGEVVPVDFLSTYIAESIGFKPVCVHTLHQQKGNSSQQMKKYGRVALRKSITIWEKP